MSRRPCFLLFAILLFASCEKNDTPGPTGEPRFSLTFSSAYSILQNETAAFLTDEDGRIRVFQWMPGPGTTTLVVPDAEPGEKFDFSVAGVFMRNLPGTSLVDTFLIIRTYTNLVDSARFDLIPPGNEFETDFKITFTGITSLDSIVVPNGVTFALPQPDNNFQGQYLVQHNGQFWCRVKVNGESKWRYLLLDNVTGSTINVTRDATTLPELPPSTVTVALPFFTNWTYRLDRSLDADHNKFLPLGPQFPIPGGVVPFFDAVPIQEPPGLPNFGYRLRLAGEDAAPGGHGYECDRFFTALPNAAPALNFDIQPTNLADKRLIAVTSSGPVDVLSFTRTGSTNISWEVFAAPAASGATIYRLPDVPTELSNIFPILKTYDFDSKVQVRAEGYDQFGGYDAAIRERMYPQDPLWQARAGYLARIRTF